MQQEFDAIARALATGDVSRRQSLRQLGGLLGAAVLASFGIGCAPEAATGPAAGRPLLRGGPPCRAEGRKCRSASQCCNGNCVNGRCSRCPEGDSPCSVAQCCGAGTSCCITGSVHTCCNPGSSCCTGTGGSGVDCCGPDQTCNNGECVCPAGTTRCDVNCCGAGQCCQFGLVCVETCQERFSCVDGQCVFTG
jgi:hypothetical protein